MRTSSMSHDGNVVVVVVVYNNSSIVVKCGCRKKKLVVLMPVIVVNVDVLVFGWRQKGDAQTMLKRDSVLQ